MSIFMRKVALLAGTALLAAPAAFAADVTTTVASGDTRTAVIAANAPAAGDTHTVEVDGTLRGTNAASLASVVITGTGAGQVIINNDGRIQGRLDFSGLTGGVTFNNNTGPDPTTQGWHVQGNATSQRVLFSAGDDVLNNNAGAVIGVDGNGTAIDFGGGTDDVFNNAGLLVVARNAIPRTLTISNLETWNNSGVVVLGASFSAADAAYPPPSDGNGGSRLSVPGVDYVASDGARIAMDVQMDLVQRATCTSPESAAAGDCIDFIGGSTSGVTLLTLQNLPVENGGAYNPVGVTLIDVAGGTSHMGDFMLDPATSGYSAHDAFGGGVRVGAFSYSVAYDVATQSHRLVGLAGHNLLGLGVVPSAAQDLWRVGDEANSARQAELRRAASDSAGGVWAKVSGAAAERETSAPVSVFGLTDNIALDYEQDSTVLAVGADFVGGEDGRRYAVGGMLGYAQSKLSFDNSISEAEFTGPAVGLYASYGMGDIFVDAAASGQILTLDGDIESFPEQVESEITTIGLRAEAGWRLSPMQGLSVEPLAGVAYARTWLEDVKLPGDVLNTVAYEKAVSFRAGLGARAMLETNAAGLDVDLSLTGRLWKELEGEAAAVVESRGADLPLSDDFSGDFGELDAAVGISSGAVSSYLSIGGRFADGYQSANAILGVRYNW